MERVATLDSLQGLGSLIANQRSMLQSNYPGKQFQRGFLVLVNYMPTVKFIRPYEEIDAEDVITLMKKSGYPSPVWKTSVPQLPAIPAYGYYVELQPSGKEKRATTPFVEFKPTPQSADYPALIRVQGATTTKYYKNPNIVPIESVIRQCHTNSIIGKYLCEASNNTEEWCCAIGSIIPGIQEIYEFPSYNYCSKTFVIALQRRAQRSGDDEQTKLLNTHLFIAQAELGHYFATYKKASSTTKGSLLYCYNYEYVPIYYGLSMPSVLNDAAPSATNSWVEVLLDMLKIPETEAHTMYPTAPAFCQSPVVYDEKVHANLTGRLLSDACQTKVYYLTRYDTFAISGRMAYPSDKLRKRDGYIYRLTMPYIFHDLFNAVRATHGDSNVPQYYDPADWVVCICHHADYDADGASDNTGKYDEYVCFDINSTTLAGSSVGGANTTLAYNKYATLQHLNYEDSANSNFHRASYTAEVQSVPNMPEAHLTSEQRNALLQAYRKNFLDVFFKSEVKYG